MLWEVRCKHLPTWVAGPSNFVSFILVSMILFGISWTFFSIFWKEKQNFHECWKICKSAQRCDAVKVLSKSAWDWCILIMEGANTIQIQNIHIQMQIEKKWKYEYKYKCIEQSCDAVKVLSSRSASDWCIAVHCLEGEGETNFKVIVIVETTNIMLLTITFTSCTTSLIIWIISVIFGKTSEWK